MGCHFHLICRVFAFSSIFFALSGCNKNNNQVAYNPPTPTCEDITDDGKYEVWDSTNSYYWTYFQGGAMWHNQPEENSPILHFSLDSQRVFKSKGAGVITGKIHISHDAPNADLLVFIDRGEKDVMATYIPFDVGNMQELSFYKIATKDSLDVGCHRMNYIIHEGNKVYTKGHFDIELLP